MYKIINSLYNFFIGVIFIGFLMPIIGLTKGKRGTDSLFHINKNAYIKVSLAGVVIAILAIAICIGMKKIIRHMECEIKDLPSYTAPVVKYNLFKSRYTVVFSIEGKKYEYKFEAVKVKKVYDFKNGSFVRYKIYKSEIIPVTFYLAFPKYEKGIKDKWAYLSKNH